MWEKGSLQNFKWLKEKIVAQFFQHIYIFVLFYVHIFWMQSKQTQAVCTGNIIWSKSESWVTVSLCQPYYNLELCPVYFRIYFKPSQTRRTMNNLQYRKIYHRQSITAILHFYCLIHLSFSIGMKWKKRLQRFCIYFHTPSVLKHR